MFYMRECLIKLYSVRLGKVYSSLPIEKKMNIKNWYLRKFIENIWNLTEVAGKNLCTAFPLYFHSNLFASYEVWLIFTCEYRFPWLFPCLKKMYFQNNRIKLDITNYIRQMLTLNLFTPFYFLCESILHKYYWF